MTITLTREEAQQVLGYLEEIHPGNMTPMAEINWNKASELLRARLAQPEQRTGDCLLAGVCAAEGHRIQKAQPEPEPVAWKNSAIRLGEELSSVGPDGYYDMTPQQWLDWALDQQPRGKDSLPLPPQREFIGLTDEEIEAGFMANTCCDDLVVYEHVASAIEAKLRKKNNG
jgi:hypothetical protein